MSAAAFTPATAGDELEVRIRAQTVASLIAYGTLAGKNVEQFRVEKIEAADTPRIVVTSEQDCTGIAQAGTDPQFDVLTGLMVEAHVATALREDAVAAIDTLIAQIKDALLTDPAWTRLAERPSKIHVRRKFLIDGDRPTGWAVVAFNLGWRERWPPRITTPLKTLQLTTRVDDGVFSDTITLPAPPASAT